MVVFDGGVRIWVRGSVKGYQEAVIFVVSGSVGLNGYVKVLLLDLWLYGVRLFSLTR